MPQQSYPLPSSNWQAATASAEPQNQLAAFDAGMVAFNKGQYATAVRIWKPLADLGHAEAQCYLGCVHFFRRGVPENDDEAARLFHLAADQGNAKAQFILGGMYADGDSLPPNFQEEKRLKSLAADQGYTHSKLDFWHICGEALGGALGEALGEYQSKYEAMKHCRIGAEQGHADQQYALACFYSYCGNPIYKEIARLYRLAADQGFVLALGKLGVMYLFGHGVPVDFEESLKLLRLAADQGYVRAQYFLAGQYQYGQGVPQDHEEAMRLYRLAADEGDGYAQREVGKIYDNGIGVPQDSEEANRWYRLSESTRW
jgi:TPR repeat protein